MPEQNQAHRGPEKEISVDLSETDSSKAVSRRAAPSIASQTRDDDGRGKPKRTPAEEALFKRMSRFQRSYDQKFADAQAAWQKERSELLARAGTGVSVERGGEELTTAHEKAMAELTEKLAAANEKGDSAGAAKITAEMIKADGVYHAKLSQTAQRADTGGAGATAAAAAPKPNKGPTAAGSRFILANEEWWEDPEFEMEKAAANATFVTLVNQEGFDANSDETFKELGARLKDKFPKLDIKSVGRSRRQAREDDDEPELDEFGEAIPPKNTGRRGPAATISDRGAGAGGRQNARTLTADDIKTMRNVGMDPDKDDHVVRFLREKVAEEERA